MHSHDRIMYTGQANVLFGNEELPLLFRDLGHTIVQVNGSIGWEGANRIWVSFVRHEQRSLGVVLESLLWQIIVAQQRLMCDVAMRLGFAQLTCFEVSNQRRIVPSLRSEFGFEPGLVIW